MIHGVVVVLENEGKFLVGKRALHKKAAPGYWCPISGKIEAGETEEQALVRECMEEAGLTVEPVAKIGEFLTRDKTTTLHWWKGRIRGSLELVRNHEHSEFRWVTIEEMRQLEPVFREDLEVFANLMRRA